MIKLLASFKLFSFHPDADFKITLEYLTSPVDGSGFASFIGRNPRSPPAPLVKEKTQENATKIDSSFLIY